MNIDEPSVQEIREFSRKILGIGFGLVILVATRILQPIQLQGDFKMVKDP